MKKFPDISFTEWRQAEEHDGSYCHAFLRLDAMPSFLYTRLDLPGSTLTTQSVNQLLADARRNLLRQARAIKDELNEIDLGVEVSAKGATRNE